MPVDRQLFTDKLTEYHAPAWTCPRCHRGHFRLNGKPVYSTTADSAPEGSSDIEDFLNISYRFSAMLRCDHPTCRETAVVAGTGGVDLVEFEDEHGDWNQEWIEAFKVEYFSPSPALIRLPSVCPNPVKEELERAFISWWNDYSAAGNHIRGAVECMLTDLGVRKSKRVRGKLVRLPLHSRIDELPAKYVEAKEKLVAIKWLGNAGSHSGTLSANDVCDALDLFELALEDVYVKHHAAMKRLAKEVNKRKGPVRRGGRPRKRSE